MCEILLLFLLCSSLGKSIRAKGQDPLMYQVMLVVAWFVGEIMGAFIGLAVGGGVREAGPIILVFAYMGAACGAGAVFAMAGSLPNRKTGNYGGSKYGNSYGGNSSGGNNQFVMPDSLRDPYASPQPGWGPPPQQYPPQQYPQQPYPPQQYPQQQQYPSQPYPQQQYPQQQYPPQPQFPPPQQAPAAAGSIRFSCPQGHILEDDSSAAGQQRSCPICSTAFVVPGPTVAQAKPAATRPPPPQGIRPKPPGSK